MDLIAIASQLGTEEQALDFIEKMRWPEGVRCLKCDSAKVSKFEVQESTRLVERANAAKETVPVPARHLYECLECGQQFAATTGTLFHDTHLPLQKWFFAVALMVNAKKGLSARQMKRDLKVTYKTAWYLCHRIREAMQEPARIFSGTIEIDETYVGGKYDARRHRAKYDKPAVMGLIQRGNEAEHSKVQAFRVPRVTRPVVARVLTERVSPAAKLYTDEHAAYRHLGRNNERHAIVIHSKGEYVRGDVHVNAVENFWSLVKRQIIGQHHFVSIKHLQRYLNEVSWKFNNREAESLFLMVMVNLLIGSALPYAKLIARPAASSADVSGQED